MYLQKTKNFVSATLILLLAFSAFAGIIPFATAQTTPTPQNWINLITQTPGGAWRPETGVTKYPWTTSIGGNPQRTGFTNSPAAKTNHTLWSEPIPTHDWAEGVIANGTVFVVNMDQNDIFAVNAYTGEKVWQYNLPLPPSNETHRNMLGDWNNDNFIDIAYNQIFAGYGDTMKTICLGTQSGALNWIAPDEGRNALICPPGTVFPNSYALYIIAQYHAPYMITCYKIGDSEQISVSKVWSHTNDAVSGERLSYNDGKLYEAMDGLPWASCLNAATGELIWNYTLPLPHTDLDTFYQHPVIADGKAYFCLKDNKVECLDANDGHRLWEYVSGGDYVNCIAVANGRAYLPGGSENKLYCLNATTGEQLWEYQAYGPLEYYTPIIAEGLVYFPGAAEPLNGFPYPGTYQGYMYCLDATTGNLVWKYLLQNDATCTWFGDGNLYTTTPFSQLWCWGAGPTATTLAANGQGTQLLYGSVTDLSPFSQKHPEQQSPLISDAPVTLSYVKDGTWTDFATVKTASDGTFMYSWTPPSEGAYKIVARYEGNDAYHWSSGQTALQVSASSTTTSGVFAYTSMDTVIMAAVIVAIVIGIVNLYALRKRK